jgi:hypothetical protein
LFSSNVFSKDDSSRVVSLQGEYDVKHDVVLRVCRRNKRIGKKERIRGVCDMVGFGVGRNGGGRFSAV